MHHHTPICHIKFSDWRWNQTIHVLSICFHRWPSHGLWAGTDGPNAATHAIPAAGCRTWSDVGIIPIISKLNLQSTNMLMLNIDLSPFAHLRCCWNKVCTNQTWVSYWQYLLKQFLPWTRRGSAEGAIEILYVSNLTQQTVWFVNSVPFQTPTFFLSGSVTHIHLPSKYYIANSEVRSWPGAGHFCTYFARAPCFRSWYCRQLVTLSRSDDPFTPFCSWQSSI